MTNFKPCPFCHGTSVFIEPGGQTWRGVKGYSAPQYFTLKHHGELSKIDTFPICHIQLRVRTEEDAIRIWNSSGDIKNG